LGFNVGSTGEAKADPQLLRQFWRSLGEPGEVREVRIPNARYGGPARLFGTVSGYFDDEDRFVTAVTALTGRDCEAVYVTLNPVKRDLLARAANRLVNSAKNTTTDADVICRTKILIDIDPRRPSGVSATDTERIAAVRVRDQVAAFLLDLWGTHPVYSAMTGNGGGLVYQIDLPNDADSLNLVTGMLKALASQFDDSEVSIDQSVANAARITKVIGTIAAKGDDTPSLDRRWRRATADFPTDPRVVTREQLQMLAGLSPSIERRSERVAEVGEDDDVLGRANNHGVRNWTVLDLLAEHDLVAREVEKPYGTIYELDHCLTSTDHADGAAIVELSSGALAYRCHHNSCADRTWTDARSALGLPSREAAGVAASDHSGPTGRHAQRAAARPILTRVSDVEPEEVKWLVPGRIPLGKITILEGDPGLGKSTLLVDIAARMTIGSAMPDGTYGDIASPTNVIIVSAEDGAGDTIRPRLEVAGADLRRAYILEAVESTSAHPSRADHPVNPDRRPPNLFDIDALREAIVEVGARLVTIDPLMAFLPAKVDSHKDQDVRGVLARLKDLAEETGAAIVLVRHLNKNEGGSAVYRGGGSIGIIGAARVALLVAKDPDDAQRRVLAVTKNNLSKEMPSLGFELVDADGGVARVQWLGTTRYSADDLVAPRSSEAETSAVDEAVEVLKDILWHGPVPAAHAKRQALDAGISGRTLDRAKKKLCVKVWKRGFAHGSRWVWELPPQSSAVTVTLLQDAS
jgi:archaellum biogenesis ATPase FlaH